MFWGQKAVRALLCGALSATLGCCYHAQHFGKKRDIGIGEVGCATCKTCPAPCDSGCATDGRGPGGAPLRTSAIVHGSNVMSVAYQEPHRGPLRRLRDKIDGRHAERIEFVVPYETEGSTVVATTSRSLAVPASGTTVTDAEPAIAPVSAVTPPLQPMPADVPIRDAEQK